MRVLFSLILTISFARRAQSKKQKGDSSIPLPTTEPTVVKRPLRPLRPSPPLPRPRLLRGQGGRTSFRSRWPARSWPALDLSLLKDTSLCIFPS